MSKSVIPATLNATPAGARFCRACKNFRVQQDGSLIIFSLFVFVAMLMSVAVGIDVIRSEVLRTKLQNTSDRAVLAAADLEQTLSTQAVVNDYFMRAGLPSGAASVASSSGFGTRTVEANTSLPLPTALLHWLGDDALDVVATSTANETVSNVEISMVLDYSMSMRGNKYNNLRAAASTFVDTIFDGPAGPGTSINYVPYGGHVNTGSTLFALTGGQRI